MAAHYVNNSDIRLAVAGFGSIAQLHIGVFRALGATIVASANRSPEGRLKASRDGGIEKTYDDVLRMVERERPDGVLVTASVLSQFDVIRQLVPSGIPLLVEKPPAVAFADWALLRDLIQANGLPVMVGLNRRYYSVYKLALERMGGIGAVTSVSVEWCEDPSQMAKLGHSPELLPLLNFANSIHGLDLLVFFAGSSLDPQVWGRNLDTTGMRLRWQMLLHYLSDRGVIARFESSWDVPGRWRIVVDAPDLRMISAPLESATLLARGRAPETIEPSPEDRKFKPGLYAQASAFLKMIREREFLRWPAASLNEVSAAIRMAELLTKACAAAPGTRAVAD